MGKGWIVAVVLIIVIVAVVLVRKSGGKKAGSALPPPGQRISLDAMQSQASYADVKALVANVESAQPQPAAPAAPGEDPMLARPGQAAMMASMKYLETFSGKAVKWEGWAMGVGGGTMLPVSMEPPGAKQTPDLYLYLLRREMDPVTSGQKIVFGGFLGQLEGSIITVTGGEYKVLK